MSNKLSVKSLLNNFAPATKEDWQKVASAETQPGTISQLAWKWTNDLFFLPYYDKQDHETQEIKSIFDLAPAQENFHGARSWLNQPPVVVHNESAANHDAIHHLQSGADGILFECPENVDFKILLNNIRLEFCHVHFIFSHTSSHRNLFDYIGEHYSGGEKIQGGIFWKKIPAEIEGILSDSETLKNFSSLGIWNESNEDPGEEIVQALLDGVSLADRLTDERKSLEQIFSSIIFSLETGNQFFFTIAKIKALRILWYQILKSYGSDHPYDDIFIHTRCEAFRNEKFEPQANMLKSPLASLAAVSGGCQAVSVYPQEESNIMLQRMSRNVSSILREESHVNAVADPLAGSYFVDLLVNSLAKHTWSKFIAEVSEP